MERLVDQPQSGLVIAELLDYATRAQRKLVTRNETREMDDYSSDLRQTVEESTPKLLALSAEETARRRAPGKWSPKEIIGHLVDSAAQNHKRFVQAQLQDDLVFPGYDQDAWVRAQDYQGASWPALVELWRNYNFHIAHIMETSPALERTRLRHRHNLHQIAWQSVAEREATTLEYFMRDYVRHLQHHLRQILPERPRAEG